jgi:electron transfer flavoprotein alpha subunit
MTATAGARDPSAVDGVPLVFVEVRKGRPTPGSVGLLGRARGLAGHAAAIVCGPESAAVAATLGRFGADTAYYCDAGEVDPELPAPQVDALAAALRVGRYRTVLFENSVVAADIAAALACRLEAGIVWDLQDVNVRDGTLVGTKFALNDAVAIEAEWTSDVRVAVFRLGTFEPIEAPADGRVQAVEPAFSPQALAVKLVERRPAASADVALASADVIVAGGRGLKDRASLTLLEDLAAAMGGVVAVSMPLVDRGWYGHTRQVGQTGQKVRPRLYLACGISGQLGHRVGMERSRVIVAINTDPTAPIFGICDAGVVGDLHEIVPELTRRFREAQRPGSPS